MVHNLIIKQIKLTECHGRKFNYINFLSFQFKAQKKQKCADILKLTLFEDGTESSNTAHTEVERLVILMTQDYLAKMPPGQMQPLVSFRGNISHWLRGDTGGHSEAVRNVRSRTDHRRGCQAVGPVRLYSSCVHSDWKTVTLCGSSAVSAVLERRSAHQRYFL